MTARRILASALVCAFLGLGAKAAHSHCQMPCGIYGDAMRYVLMVEHLATMEKSIKKITALARKKKPVEVNQRVRWINNKDHHADEFTEIVTYYFMAQRVKPAEGAKKEAYLKQLELLHRMMVLCMQVKQTVDLEKVAELRDVLQEFRRSYFTEADDLHIKDHHPKGH